MKKLLSKYIEVIRFKSDYILFNKLNGSIILLPEDEILSIGKKYFILNEEEDNLLELEDNDYFIDDRIIEEYIRSLNNSHITPDTNIIISVTEMCNLNCSYCYQRNWDKQSHMDKSEYLKLVLDYISSILSKLDNDGILHINFIGGEPLLNTEMVFTFVEKIEALCANSVPVVYHMDTNGMLLTENILEHFPNLELNVTLSFPDDHNKLRCNSFQGVLKGLKRISSLIDQDQYKLVIRYNANHENVHAVNDFLEYLVNDIKIKFMFDLQNTINFDCGSFVNFLSDSELTYIYIDNIIEKLEQLNIPYNLLPSTSLTRQCFAENYLSRKFYSNGEHVICDVAPKSSREKNYSLDKLPEMCITCSDFPLCGGIKPCDSEKCAGRYKQKAETIAKVIAYTKKKLI